MKVLTEKDRLWWIAMEDQVLTHLVDLAGYGFVVDHSCFREGWTDDGRVLLRRRAAEALVRARDAMPPDHNFKVFDGWRPWEIQQRCADQTEAKTRAAHPDWTDPQVADHVARMAPRLRVVPHLGSHRYGGAVDLTVVAPDGKELNMGVPVDYCTGPEADLLYYHLRDDLDQREMVYRENRSLLIRAMAAGGFDPYLAEFWHWGYRGDL
jgi:D-alanyl-D-alanine dipeptidase